VGCYYITTQHPFVPTQITGLATSCLAWLLYPLETYCNPTPLRHSFNFDIWLMMNRIRNSDENPPDDGSDPRYNGISSSWIISCNRGHYKTRDWVIETTIQTLAFMLPTDVLITTDKRRTDCMVVACSCFQSFDGSAAQEHPCDRASCRRRTTHRRSHAWLQTQAWRAAGRCPPESSLLSETSKLR